MFSTEIQSYFLKIREKYMNENDDRLTVSPIHIILINKIIGDQLFPVLKLQVKIKIKIFSSTYIYLCKRTIYK